MCNKRSDMGVTSFLSIPVASLVYLSLFSSVCFSQLHYFPAHMLACSFSTIFSSAFSEFVWCLFQKILSAGRLEYGSSRKMVTMRHWAGQLEHETSCHMGSWFPCRVCDHWVTEMFGNCIQTSVPSSTAGQIVEYAAPTHHDPFQKAAQEFEVHLHNMEMKISNPISVFEKTAHEFI